eukprot:SAG31_NODE_32322_length_357_cov_0.864341_1_plen_77_part_01
MAVQERQHPRRHALDRAGGTESVGRRTRQRAEFKLCLRVRPSQLGPIPRHSGWLGPTGWFFKNSTTKFTETLGSYNN